MTVATTRKRDAPDDARGRLASGSKEAQPLWRDKTLVSWRDAQPQRAR